MSGSPYHYFLNSPFIIVDDTDPLIRYNGTWNAANETDLQAFHFSPRTPYFNTLHVLQIFGGSFLYDFQGTGISVFATPMDNTSYTSQCFVDGNLLNVDPNSAKTQFGLSSPVCQAFGLAHDRLHTLSVVVSVPARELGDTNTFLSGFAFDYMLIQGIENPAQDVLVPILDRNPTLNMTQPILNFGFVLDLPDGRANATGKWQFDLDNGFSTITQGSEFSATFTGTSLWWYGYIATNADLLVSFGTFSVDGGAPSTFEVVASKTLSSQLFLFKTPDLQNGTHLLTVVYHGGNASMPLTLQSLIIQKMPSTTMPTLPTSPLTSKRVKVGGIIGGIAGGIIFLLLVASVVCISIQRNRKKQRSMKTRADSVTAIPEPFPISTRETDGMLAPRKVQPGHENVPHPLMQHQLQSPPLTKWTRRHTISHSLGHTHSLSTAVIPHQGLPSSRISHSFIDNDSHTGPINTHTSINEQPTVQPETLNSITSTTLPIAQDTRQEDSGLRIASASDLPPMYTTH